jgi:hypothetical protein
MAGRHGRAVADGERAGADPAGREGVDQVLELAWGAAVVEVEHVAAAYRVGAGGDLVEGDGALGVDGQLTEDAVQVAEGVGQDRRRGTAAAGPGDAANGPGAEGGRTAADVPP